MGRPSKYPRAGNRIEEIDAKPSPGTVGDSFDSAVTQAVNGLCNAELIRQRGAWRTVDQVELATLEHFWGWNSARLHGEPDLIDPFEVEQAYHADHVSGQTGP